MKFDKFLNLYFACVLNNNFMLLNNDLINLNIPLKLLELNNF